jgi:hypothetical protein
MLGIAGGRQIRIVTRFRQAAVTACSGQFAANLGVDAWVGLNRQETTRDGCRLISLRSRAAGLRSTSFGGQTCPLITVSR